MNTRITKLAAIIAAAALAGATLTACSGGNAEETTAETTTAAESVVESDTEAETETETEAVESETEAVESETEAVESETEAEASGEEITEDDETAGDEAEVEAPVSDNPLMPLVDAAMSVGEWPWLEEVTDAQVISDFFLMDQTKYEQSVFMQCPMSATMCEIIIVKSDDVDSAKADLEARQKKAQDMDAFYPKDVERAGASIVGTEGSYAYFIMADSASDVENALVEAIKAI